MRWMLPALLLAGCATGPCMDPVSSQGVPPQPTQGETAGVLPPTATWSVSGPPYCEGYSTAYYGYYPLYFGSFLGFSVGGSHRAGHRHSGRRHGFSGSRGGGRR